MDVAVDSDRLRTRFLRAGMAVLARQGYVGFKQSAVCAEAGVTTGAFYHSFRNWKAFEAELIAHWRREATEDLVESARLVTDPRERITALIDIALNLPHATESAIRTWAAHDPCVHSALSAVESDRRNAIAEMGTELYGTENANRLAAVALMLLSGFENSTDPSLADFKWAMEFFAVAALPPGAAVDQSISE